MDVAAHTIDPTGSAIVSSRRSGLSRSSWALHFSSIRPNRQIRSATAQVRTNMPTMTKPMTLRSMPSIQSHKAAGPTQLLGQQAQQFDAADDQRDRHRQPGDRDVVVHLAHRLGERPAVGEIHERAVDGVQQAHARGEKNRKAQDRVPRQAGRGAGAGENEQRDFGGGVEAESEQHAEGIHLPRLRDRLGEAAEEPVHEAAVVQLLFE